MTPPRVPIAQRATEGVLRGPSVETRVGRMKHRVFLRLVSLLVPITLAGQSHPTEPQEAPRDLRLENMKPKPERARVSRG